METKVIARLKVKVINILRCVAWFIHWLLPLFHRIIHTQISIFDTNETKQREKLNANARDGVMKRREKMQYITHGHKTKFIWILICNRFDAFDDEHENSLFRINITLFVRSFRSFVSFVRHKQLFASNTLFSRH